MVAAIPQPALAQAVGPAGSPPGAYRLRAAAMGAGAGATEPLAYAGMVPGPLLRVKRGAELRVRLANGLVAPTAIHWHGIRGPNAMDGVTELTQPGIAPDAGFDYRFAPPDAGTFWYHADAVTDVMRGLYGALIVDEAERIDVDRDHVLILAREQPQAGRTGLVLVNGQRALDLPVIANERLRLRLINAAPEAIAVRIGQHSATVAAIDGQPGEPFEARDARVTLGPGNRVDLIVDARLAPGATSPIIVETTAGVATPARLLYAPGPPARARPRDDTLRLPPNPLPDRIAFRDAMRVEMTMTNDGARKRGRAPAEQGAGRFGKPAFSVKRGRTVMLAFANPSTTAFAVHIHGHAFRLLDALDDGWKPFWLDSIVVTPQQTTRIAFVADNPGRWLIERRALGTTEGAPVWFAVI
jgi:FtsP/CotA-like multicopper oxidase with cupredoxin domain